KSVFRTFTRRNLSLQRLRFELPEATCFTSEGGNTLKYDIPVITNESQSGWIGEKLDPLRFGEYGILQLPP
ncbi:MAG: hypothetical protein ABFD29_05525, partial [Anaerolineaceae bacterium]